MVWDKNSDANDGIAFKNKKQLFKELLFE